METDREEESMKRTKILLGVSLAVAMLTCTGVEVSAAESYRERYPDLYASYGYNIGRLYYHYCVYGKVKGRIAASQSLVKDWKIYKKIDHAEENQQTVKKSYTETINYDDDSYTVINVVDDVVRNRVEYDADGFKYYEEERNSADQLIAEVKYKAPDVVDTKNTYTYNADGQLVEKGEYQGDGAGVVKGYEYDSYHRLKKETAYSKDASGNQTLMTYREYTYKGKSTLVLQETLRDLNHQLMESVTYGYYPSGALFSVMRKDGENIPTSYYETYENGKMKTERYYDTKGEVISVVSFDEAGEEHRVDYR